MTEFLVKHFVKQYEQTEKEEVRTSYGVLASMVGICCNILLFAAKLFIGLLVNSVSVMADAFNNLSDAASSIIGFIGVRMAGKPADDDHPFGHGRIEYISAFIVAFLVIQVGFSLFKSSVGKILHPEDMTFKWISVIILLLSIGVNIDGITGLLVSLAVLFAGYSIAKDTLAPLIGEAIPPEVYKDISNFVESFDGILGTHDLIVHNYGPSKSMASIHAEVSASTDIAVSHAIVDRIEREAARKMGLLLVIHMDPVETDNERLNTYRKILEKVLFDVDVRLNFHDFRMVGKDKNVCLIFDLVVPREYKGSAVGKLKARISNEMRRRDPDCRCAITVENSYLSES